ncbi:hypothetical protein TPHA_0G01250 [Tetrapisispora phaffii CBS 4417]|uniref:ribonuclease H n=1 Tax=Tetrapisispora phaffii (strain ATCC 24235 / CBS 4417 / NBRC 1672 / NRRL Y-8282 / UCD 70-5) TaxID=1071381 RepID=G8BVN4_TETPH|nr:hypothetical protein TPHA_0G01250 [Tetrapisispora phaffii CBS 4417]CCE63962.1 hypothetical protein TPHA_0G01250 [Tetrapisispora phaffii CBS 4417]
MAGSRVGPSQFYAVRIGRKPGIFYNWDACALQVKGFPGAIFKKFKTLNEAEQFVGIHKGNVKSKSKATITTHNRVDTNTTKVSEINSEITLQKPTLCSKRQHEDSDNFSSDEDLLNALTVKKDGNKISKFYGVKSDNPQVRSKIFNDWNQCRKYMRGAKGITFKSFATWADARNFISKNFENPVFDYELLGVNAEEFENKIRVTSPDFKYGKEVIHVYCDGSSLSNGKSSAKAGSGAFFDHPELLQYNVSEPLDRSKAQTNNRAEATAIYKVLVTMEELLIHKKICAEFNIFSDSEYAIKLLNDRYKVMSIVELKKIPNYDILWKLIKQFVKIKRYYIVNKELYSNKGKFKIQWVKGHSGDYGNEMADKLAKEGAMKG